MSVTVNNSPAYKAARLQNGQSLCASDIGALYYIRNGSLPAYNTCLFQYMRPSAQSTAHAAGLDP